MIFQVIALLYLMANAVTDARRKEIDLRITALAGISLILLRAAGISRDWNVTPLNFAPFAVLLAANRLLSGAVGAGDVWISGMLGFLMPADTLLRSMLGGFWMAGGWGLVRKLWKPCGSKTEIPWIPFLLLAYFMECCL
ncbi:MAG TPA: hypothetical protein IAA57_05135 [Candidatus Pullilachnospira intestinigallinarum]|nr:hypothetical protein [Candidatus Pullilachnospira intestinigallinarum]